jgi:hypothetical protein
MPLGFLQIEAPGISRQSAREGGKFRQPYPPVAFTREPAAAPQCCRKDQVNEKNPLIPSGNNPATFRLTAQCFNQLRHSVPHLLKIHFNIILCFMLGFLSGLFTSGFYRHQIFRKSRFSFFGT